MKRIIVFAVTFFLIACSPSYANRESLNKKTVNQVEKTVNLNENDESNSDITNFISELVDDESEVDSILGTPVEYDYSSYKKPIRNNNFISRTTKRFHDINGEDVDVDLFYRPAYSQIDHPNVGLGIMLYQAIKYKIKFPNENNEISISSFRFSIIAGVNLLPSSPYYGTMKNMPDSEIDRDGFVRISYLVTLAAKIGIKVNVISQIEGYSNYGVEINPKEYYLSVKDDHCFSKYGLDSYKVSDYMNYKSCDWSSYDGKSASDMFHVKTLAVEKYLDKDDVVHKYGVFFSSSNIDGVNYDGSLGNGGSQTGQIITNHKYLYLTTRNFLKYVSLYCNQDDSYVFRYKYNLLVKEQKHFIAKNGYDSIENDMLVYLGNENDKVFELYFSPFAEDPAEWNINNPICKYVDKLLDSDKYISFTLNNVKSSINYDFFTVMFSKINKAFSKDRGYLDNIKNRLIIWAGIDGGFFDNLLVGKHVGLKSFSGYDYIHEKDMSFSYDEDGERKTTLLLNSANLHRGAFWYQTNQFLIINETTSTGFELYDTYICAAYGL